MKEKKSPVTISLISHTTSSPKSKIPFLSNKTEKNSTRTLKPKHTNTRMGNKPGTSVSEDDLMGITAMAYITKCTLYLPSTKLSLSQNSLAKIETHSHKHNSRS